MQGSLVPKKGNVPTGSSSQTLSLDDIADGLPEGRGDTVRLGDGCSDTVGFLAPSHALQVSLQILS